MEIFADCGSRVEEDLGGHGWKGGEETNGVCGEEGEGEGEEESG